MFYSVNDPLGVSYNRSHSQMYQLMKRNDNRESFWCHESQVICNNFNSGFIFTFNCTSQIEFDYWFMNNWRSSNEQQQKVHFLFESQEIF